MADDREFAPVKSAGEQDGAVKNNLTEAVKAGANTGERGPKDEDHTLTPKGNLIK